MSKNGVKRIIFSQYTNNLKPWSLKGPNQSAPDHKREKFEAYKQHLEGLHKVYASRCNADYLLIQPDVDNYVDVQLEKILALGDFVKEGYEQICYLDFDVVPNTEKNIFEELDLNFINALSLERSYKGHMKTNDHGRIRDARFQDLLDYDAFDPQNVYVKTSAKNAMLQLEDFDTSPCLINTGVVTSGKEAILKLDFEARLQECKDMLDEAREDSLYPEEISKYFKYNNEVFFTYLIEKYKVPFYDTGYAWNFILDKKRPEMPRHNEIAHLIHHVNTEFELSFG